MRQRRHSQPSAARTHSHPHGPCAAPGEACPGAACECDRPSQPPAPCEHAPGPPARAWQHPLARPSWPGTSPACAAAPQVPEEGDQGREAPRLVSTSPGTADRVFSPRHVPSNAKDRRLPLKASSPLGSIPVPAEQRGGCWPPIAPSCSQTRRAAARQAARQPGEADRCVPPGAAVRAARREASHSSLRLLKSGHSKNGAQRRLWRQRPAAAPLSSAAPTPPLLPSLDGAHAQQAAHSGPRWRHQRGRGRQRRGHARNAAASAQHAPLGGRQGGSW